MVERADIGGQRVQVWTQTGFALAQRGVASAFMILGVRQEAETAEGLADILFEVLDFIKVPRPMQLTVARAAASQQRDSVAQALAPVGEVPDAPVLLAIEMATGTAEVTATAHVRV